jgi:hypothetical protein
LALAWLALATNGCGHELEHPNACLSAPAAAALSYDAEACAAEGADPASRAVGDVGEAEMTLTLSEFGEAFRLADGCTRLEMRPVHQTVEVADVIYGGDAHDGLPYVSTHGGWLEITHHVELYSRGYLFELTNVGCKTVVESCGDCFYTSLQSCDIDVKTSRGRPPPIVPVDQHNDFQFPTRFSTYGTSANECELLGLRELGFDIGGLDEGTNPPAVTGLDVGLDFITPFGVSNVDIEELNQQVIGSIGNTDVGPQALTWTIKDVGNVNTHCYTGVCLDIFDLDVTATTSDATARVPAVLDYR